MVSYRGGSGAFAYRNVVVEKGKGLKGRFKIAVEGLEGISEGVGEIGKQGLNGKKKG